jgi:hypothetical protein
MDLSIFQLRFAGRLCLLVGLGFGFRPCVKARVTNAGIR